MFDPKPFLNLNETAYFKSLNVNPSIIAASTSKHTLFQSCTQYHYVMSSIVNNSLYVILHLSQRVTIVVCTRYYKESITRKMVMTNDLTDILTVRQARSDNNQNSNENDTYSLRFHLIMNDQLEKTTKEHFLKPQPPLGPPN
jgi:hypothetical protein